MRISKAPEKRRAELIEAARELFDEFGVAKTKISDIVKKVGASQGVFYYYFSSKEEMVEVVVSQVAGEVREKTKYILENQHISFCQRMAGFIEIYISLIDQFLADDQTSLQELALEPLYQNNTILRSEVLMKKVLEQLIEKGVENGDLKLEYPQLSMKVLLYGLRNVANEKFPSRKQIYTIVENGLGLKKNELVSLIPIKKADPLPPMMSDL